jgi:hypothetical protein
MGKYTCLSNENESCENIYRINSYYSSTSAYVQHYYISNNEYSQIGMGAFNSNASSPAMVGYMFDKVYNSESGSPTSGSLMGNDVSYSNGTYTLLPADGESELGTTKDATHHYTCNNTTETCSKVRYYYYSNYYVELDGTANIETALNEMLYSNSVNKYDSDMKAQIDIWYEHNLSDKTNMLENIVYCNARNVNNLGGWNKDGNISSVLEFKNHNLENTLTCTNIKDQFSTSNDNARLKYPIALPNVEDLYILTNNNVYQYHNDLTYNSRWYWGLAPMEFESGAYINRIGYSGVTDDYCVFNVGGIRPVISLKKGAMISSGAGSESDPWVVE